MGMSTATCGISGLPIEEGEDVRCVLVVHHTAPECLTGAVTIGCRSMPWTLPLQGTYTGYSTPRLDDTYNRTILEDRLDIENWTYSIGDYLKKEGWDGFWAEMHRDDLVHASGDWGIGMKMVRADVMEALLPTLLFVDDTQKGFLEDCYQQDDLDEVLIPDDLDGPTLIDPHFGSTDLQEAYPVEQALFTREDGDDDDLDIGILLMYRGMEYPYHRQGVSHSEVVRYHRDKIEFMVIRRLLMTFGRSWDPDPQTHPQFPQWSEYADQYQTLLDFIHNQIGQSRYEAEVTYSDLEKHQHVQCQIERRITDILQNDHPSVNILDIDIDLHDRTVFVTYNLGDGGPSRSTQYPLERIYDA
jgi:hypothetical protein